MLDVLADVYGQNETGCLTDRPRAGRPRVTPRNQQSEPYSVDQSVRLSQYLAMCVWGWGERGEGVGAAGRFYKRFLSCPVNTQFHSHMEIASAKNTFPIYSSAIPPLYMWSIIV